MATFTVRHLRRFTRRGSLVMAAAVGMVLAGQSGPTRAADADVTSECLVTPFRTIELSSSVPGTLGAVHVDRSDLVREGQVVAELVANVERADLDLAVARAAMESDIQLSEAALVYDRTLERRFSSLRKTNAVSAQESERAARDAAISTWKLRRAQELRSLRFLEVSRAEQVLARKTIVSPLTGFVVRRFKSEGEFIEDQPVVSIAQLHPLSIEAIVPLELFGLVREGTEADVIIETDDGTSHRAVVTVVDRVADAASGTFGVRLELPNPDYEIPAGVRCSVKLTPVMRVAKTTADPSDLQLAYSAHDDADTVVGADPHAFGAEFEFELYAPPRASSSEPVETAVENIAPPPAAEVQANSESDTVSASTLSATVDPASAEPGGTAPADTVPADTMPADTMPADRARAPVEAAPQKSPIRPRRPSLPRPQLNDPLYAQTP